MRVVYAGARPQRAATGGTRYTAEVLDFLAGKGLSVSFLESEKSPPPRVKRSYLLGNFWYLWQFARLKRNEDSIVLEDYSSRVHLFLANLFLGLTRKARLVIITQAVYFSYRKSFVKNLADRAVSMLFFVPVDIVTTPSEAAAQEVVGMKVSAGRVRVVYPALSAEFASGAIRHATSDEYGPLVLLFVGRFHPIKGLEYLLRAVKLLGDDDLRLTVVGDTQQGHQAYVRKIFDEVKALGIESKVDFVGRKDGMALCDMYRSGDVFIVPSLYESYPIVLMEAMSFGLPVVASRAGGIPELVDDGINGILVPPKNPGEMAKAIHALADAPDLRSKMGREGYRKAVRLRSRTWNNVGEEHHRILSELLQR